jgi:YD repeat-containing protein
VLQKLVFIFFVVIFWQCATAPAAQAQNNSGCFMATTWWFPDPIPPGWYYFGPYPAPFVYLIAAKTSTCAPPAAPTETCPQCPPPSPPSAPGSSSGPPPSSPQLAAAGQPISLGTGNTFIKQTDVSLPGLGGGLSLTRTWNSQWPATQLASSTGDFGPSWRSTYEERIFMSGDNYLKYARGDGSFWSFGINPNNGKFVVAAPAYASATLLQGATSWILTFKNGEQRQFNLTTGLLTAIVDRNGNTTQLTYDSSNRLTTITDPASRHLYFNYGTGSLNLLVTSVTSDFGVTLSYAYDAQNRLSQVTKPDLTTVTFTYNSQSQITSVTDSNGKVLESHTYDSSGRGLTSSLANGVESLTITYP